MTEVEGTARIVQEVNDALIAANKRHDDATRRAENIKHVRDITPAEIKTEERRRGWRS